MVLRAVVLGTDEPLDRSAGGTGAESSLSVDSCEFAVILCCRETGEEADRPGVDWSDCWKELVLPQPVRYLRCAKCCNSFKPVAVGVMFLLFCGWAGAAAGCAAAAGRIPAGRGSRLPPLQDGFFRTYPVVNGCLCLSQTENGAAISILLFFLINLFALARREAFTSSRLFLLQKAY